MISTVTARRMLAFAFFAVIRRDRVIEATAPIADRSLPDPAEWPFERATPMATDLVR